MTALHQIFSFVCGQTHVWTVGGQTLPLCQRCTGLYVGAACALGSWAFFRPRATDATLCAHGIALLLMVPFGYHLVPQNGDIRTLTGYVFGFGLVYFLLLIPGRDGARAPAGAGQTPGLYGYVAGFAAGAAAVVLAVHLGGTRTAVILSWISIAGVAALAILSAVNLFLLPGYVRRAAA